MLRRESFDRFLLIIYIYKIWTEVYILYTKSKFEPFFKKFLLYTPLFYEGPRAWDVALAHIPMDKPIIVQRNVYIRYACGVQVMWFVIFIYVDNEYFLILNITFAF